MNCTDLLIKRYKHLRSLRQLRRTYGGKYAFVGIGGHSTDNLYPVLDYLHVPLKYICCRSSDKLSLIEAARPGVRATTSLPDVLANNEVKGVFVAAAPQAHFALASEVLRSGKALFIEKPPCQTLAELKQLIALQQEAQAVVAVGLQKRSSPIMRILKKELKGCNGPITYNLRYLTGAYPEGDALLDLFIHPLDCMTSLFGEATLRWAEAVDGHTLLLMLSHRRATGILELSTAYSWSNATEQWTINTAKGTYDMAQFDELTFRSKPRQLMGVPLEKVFPHRPTAVSLFNRNNFVPLRANNQIVAQGYFDTVKGFVDAVEGNGTNIAAPLDSLVATYSLMESIRTRISEGIVGKHQK